MGQPIPRRSRRVALTGLFAAMLLMSAASAQGTSSSDKSQAGGETVQSDIPVGPYRDAPSSITEAPTLSRDAVHKNITDQYPTVAGIFVEGAELVISLVGEGQSHLVAIDEVKPGTLESLVLAELDRGGFEQAIRVEYGARFTVLELGRWHRAISASFLGLPGAISSDVNERENVITLEAERVEVISPALTRLLEVAGVPAPAVVLEDAEPVTSESLQANVRPLVAGIQVQTVEFNCSLGMPAQRQGIAGFITNSHCTEQQGGVEATNFYQANLTATTRVGQETVDPVYTAANCPAGRICRFSDTAFIQTLSHIPLAYAAIPRMTALGDPHAFDGQLYPVVDVHLIPVMGELVDKIGRTTGHTFGIIDSTCVDLNVADSNITLICQDQGSYDSAGGDSGGVVYRTSPGNSGEFEYMGIHWGSGGSFSAFFNILQNEEMGPLGLV